MYYVKKKRMNSDLERIHKEPGFNLKIMEVLGLLNHYESFKKEENVCGLATNSQGTGI